MSFIQANKVQLVSLLNSIFKNMLQISWILFFIPKFYIFESLAWMKLLHSPLFEIFLKNLRKIISVFIHTEIKKANCLAL